MVAPVRNQARDAEIRRLHLAGRTFVSIAAQFKLTATRVAQICEPIKLACGGVVPKRKPAPPRSALAGEVLDLQTQVAEAGAELLGLRRELDDLKRRLAALEGRPPAIAGMDSRVERELGKMRLGRTLCSTCHQTPAMLGKAECPSCDGLHSRRRIAAGSDAINPGSGPAVSKAALAPTIAGAGGGPNLAGARMSDLGL